MIMFTCKLFYAQFMLSFLPTALGAQDGKFDRSQTVIRKKHF